MVCQYFVLVLFNSAWVISENTVLNIRVCFQACKLSWTNEGHVCTQEDSVWLSKEQIRKILTNTLWKIRPIF